MTVTCPVQHVRDNIDTSSRYRSSAMKRWSELRHHLASFYALILLGRDSNNVRHVFSIGDAQDHLAEAARVQGRCRDPFADPDLERLWQEKYCPGKYDLDALLRLPPDTLGGAYARHMEARGLRPDFYDDVRPRHRLHYLRLRIRQTHDIWHTLTGYDTDPLGELGLQGFYFGQVTNGQSALILAGGLIRCLLTGSYFLLENYVSVFAEGYQHGRSAHSLLPVKWEGIWSEPLEEIRARYAIRCKPTTSPPGQLAVEAPRRSLT